MQKRGREERRRSALYSRIPSLERREGWREDWKDKQMERRQKRKAGDRKRLLFLSPEEKKEGVAGSER